MELQDLKYKIEIQKKTIEEILNFEDNTDIENSRYSACLRFIDGFLKDLNKLKSK